VLHSIPVVFIFTTAGVILYVSTITYLGFGISPSIAELGMRVNTGNAYAQQVPWFGTKANNNFICNSINMGDDR
jgi:ABC-type dipeptide/oligopeptide/nickel transport system permease subunit